jgi:hypothetical protein
MKRAVRDVIATLLVATIVVPYVGYVVRDEMPFIKDPRGMSAVGLVLGAAAFFVAGFAVPAGAVGKIEIGLALISLGIGITAMLAAETFVAEAMLAAFMVSIVVFWAVKMLDHAGLTASGTAPPAGLRR